MLTLTRDPLQAARLLRRAVIVTGVHEVLVYLDSMLRHMYERLRLFVMPNVL